MGIDAARLADAQGALKAHGKVRGHAVELTDDAAVAAAARAEARIDILVNNAGITGGNATTWELDPFVLATGAVFDVTGGRSTYW